MMRVEITTVNIEQKAKQKLHFLLPISLYECLKKNWNSWQQPPV